MKIFISGGAGFGGSGLVKELLKRGHKVAVLDLTAPNHADNLKEVFENPDFKYIWKATFDVQPEDVEGYEVICAFNAQADVPMGFSSPVYTVYQNSMGLINLLEAVRKTGCKKFILPSTGNVFGRPPKIPIDETCSPVPHNVYSASKISQEVLCWAYHRSYGLPVVIFRNGAVYGENMRKNIFIYIWLKNLLEGKPIIVEGGDQTRDPCYVSDTIDAWLLGVEAPEEKVVGNIFQVSKGEEYKVGEIAEMCLKLVPGEIQIADYRPGEKGQRECFDISKARKVLGYNPKVGLEKGLLRTKD
ncbi:MAG: NAD-dependent epimerase/dehydratase family protein, partial [Candidatus Nealsonbacteria bacterium]|nr:NAD-dependent epimerase/dehydratase family protein [Candidatus Nealsonbacteria bacterium]